MKAVYFFIFSIITATLLLSSCERIPYNSDGSKVSQQQAIEIAKKNLSGYQFVYIINEPLLPQTKITISIMGAEDTHLISPDYESWLAYAWTNPQSNGEMKLKVIYINAFNGRCSEFSVTGSISNVGGKELYDCFIFIGTAPEKPSGNLTKSTSVSSCRKNNDLSLNADNTYAVIISGGYSLAKNYYRYWNDCSFLYKTLVNDYNIPKSNLNVLISDGLNPANDRNCGTYYDSSPFDLDGDNIPDINYAATYSNINTVFTDLGNTVSSGDNLLVYVIDHGDRDTTGQSLICLWGSETISGYQLNQQLLKINPSARIHIVLGQCYSGGMITDLSGQNRTISTACYGVEESNAMADLEYDEFVYHWTCAIAGHDHIGGPVDAEINIDGSETLYEAFNYAREEDVFYKSNIEHPQYNSIPQDLGAHYNIVGEYSYYPVIYGDEHLGSTFKTYSLQGLPPAYDNIVWTKTSGLYGSSSNSNISLAENLPSSLVSNETLTATISSGASTYVASKNIKVWKTGIWNECPLICGNYDSDGGSFYLDQHFPEATNYYWSCNNSRWEADFQGYYFSDFVNHSFETPSTLTVNVQYMTPLGIPMYADKTFTY